jgi:ABC-type nickel/cobalt efflux system permease component RcnA
MHAVFLGGMVTFTHTVTVFFLGFATLFLSRYVLPERIYPVLGAISGISIVGIGAVLLYQRARPHHHHDHGHRHIPEGEVSMASLVALGASGGLVPCPSALVLLLTAVSLGRTGLGLILLVAFSAGLAVVLAAIGLAVLYAKHWLPDGQETASHAVFRYLPVVSAAVIVCIGVVMTWVSLGGRSLALSEPRPSGSDLLPAPNQPIHADGSRSRRRQVQIDEAIQDRQFPAVFNWPQSPRSVDSKVGHNHFSAKQKCNRPREKPDDDQKPSGGLQEGGPPEQGRKHRDCAFPAHTTEHAHEFLQPVATKQKPHNDPQNRPRIRLDVPRPLHNGRIARYGPSSKHMWSINRGQTSLERRAERLLPQIGL